MSPWRLEALRLWRTRRLIALASAFVLLGLGIPLLTYELPELVKHSSGGVRIVVPRQTPADALAGFGQNAAQLGTLVLVVVAAASLAIDARPALAAFYRTRARRPSSLVLPRCVAVALAGSLALGLGILSAWYETGVLIGPLPAGTIAAGLGLGSVWVCFCVAVVAVWASVVRTASAVAGASLASLLALALLGTSSTIAAWSPATLAASVADVARACHPGVPWHAVAVAAAGTLALLATAVWRLARRAI